LGTLALRDLSLAMETMAGLQKGKRPLPQASYSAFQINALAVGLLGRRFFAGDRRKADDAFVAGMLRDMGHLVLATRPAGSDVVNAPHAALSAYLLGLWGIPHSVLEAVAFHEQPERVEHDRLEVVDVVNLADAVVSRLSPSPFQEPPVIDTERFERLGVTPGALTELEATAGQVLREAREMLAP
jgi:HD-like signal output (HDOD) protein